MYLYWQKRDYVPVEDEFGTISFTVAVARNERTPKGPRRRTVVYLGGGSSVLLTRGHRTSVLAGTYACDYRCGFWNRANLRLDTAVWEGRLTEDEASRFRSELAAAIPPPGDDHLWDQTYAACMGDSRQRCDLKPLNLPAHLLSKEAYSYSPDNERRNAQAHMRRERARGQRRG